METYSRYVIQMIESVYHTVEDILMYHYAYLLTFPNGMKYIGAHTTHLKPELDTCYLGSGSQLPEDRIDMRHLIDKTILGIFESRKALMDYEEDFIITNKCREAEHWYNQVRRTYDRYGQTPWNAGIKGIIKNPTSGATHQRRYGKGNRTPAQIEGAKSMKQKLTGVKNPAKGKPGIANSGFKPWYAITNEGTYLEFHSKTKQEFAKELGVTPRQLIHRFHYTNEHLEARTKPFKGWTFGNLPKP